MRRMRQGLSWPVVLAGLAPALLLSLGGCSLNPATGDASFTAFMSIEDELRIREEEHPKILDQFGGVYADPALTAYVAEIGLNRIFGRGSPSQRNEPASDGA